MFLLWPRDPCKRFSSLACNFFCFLLARSLSHSLTYLIHLTHPNSPQFITAPRLNSTQPRSHQIKSNQVLSLTYVPAHHSSRAYSLTQSFPGPHLLSHSVAHSLLLPFIDPRPLIRTLTFTHLSTYSPH